MRLRLYVAPIVLLGLALAGCAGTNVTPGPSSVNPASQAAASGLGSGVQDSETFGPGVMHRGAPALRVNPDASYKRALYIADQNNNNVKILTNTHYNELGLITNGIDYPADVFTDQHGNLYVANEEGVYPYGGDVTEYPPGATSPSFTYNASLHYPFAVTVDRHGNVYVADTLGNGGSINEYYQGDNAVSQSCVAPSFPFAVAVDASGDVFVGTEFGLLEYIGGLSGCNATDLNPVFVTKMVLDSNNNLILTEQSTLSVVEVLDPPYTSVSRTIGSGFTYAYGVSVNKKNKLVFVSDADADNITVINYQTGENVKVLSGASYGIKAPISVVDAPNAVY